MEIENIREYISIELGMYSEWADELNDTSPGHYGVESWDAEIMPKDIWVDIPNRTFSFKSGQFSFTLTLGSSKGDNSFEDTFSKSVSGNGTWDFSSNNSVIINSLEVEFDTVLYNE